MIKILLVDDIAAVLRALSWRLGFETEIEVVGQTGRGSDALALAAALHPDVIVMDLHMQGRNDLSLVGELHRALPESALVILSAADELELLRASLNGYCSVVSKFQPPEVLLTAIRATAPSRAN